MLFGVKKTVFVPKKYEDDDDRDDDGRTDGGTAAVFFFSFAIGCRLFIEITSVVCTPRPIPVATNGKKEEKKHACTHSTHNVNRVCRNLNTRAA